MTTPFLILIDGPMGSGKTTISKLLNQTLPNTARVALPDIKRLIPNYQENEKNLTVIRAVMQAMADTYLKHGVNVIVEQITRTEGMQVLKEVAEKHGATFYVYRLTAPRNIRLQRVHERTRMMMDVAELPKSKIEELSGYFEPNDQFYIDNPIDSAELIDTSELSPEEVVEMITKKMS